MYKSQILRFTHKILYISIIKNDIVVETPSYDVFTYHPTTNTCKIPLHHCKKILHFYTLILSLTIYNSTI